MVLSAKNTGTNCFPFKVYLPSKIKHYVIFFLLSSTCLALVTKKIIQLLERFPRKQIGTFKKTLLKQQ